MLSMALKKTSLKSALCLAAAGWIWLAGSPQARAQAPAQAPKSLADILALARERNPDLQAARKSWEATRERAEASTTWPDPEVGVQFMGVHQSTLNLKSANERSIDISQTIPFPGKLSLRGKAAAQEARREEENYHGTGLEVLAQVKAAYYALLLADRAVAIARQNADILRQFAGTAERKYGTGKVSQSDVLRAQVELSRQLNEVLTAGQARETAQARLNALLDRSPEEPLAALEEPVPAPLAYSYADLEQMALERRPEVLAVRHEVERRDAELDAAKADYLPDFTLQYSWRSFENGPSDSIAMAKMTLPFAWFWRRQALVGSARAQHESAQAMLRSASAVTRYEVKELLVNVQTSLRLVELYRTTVIPQAEASLRVAEAGYRTDKVDFLKLLDSDRALIDFRLDYYKYLSKYGSDLARLERIVGTDLSQNPGEQP